MSMVAEGAKKVVKHEVKKKEKKAVADAAAKKAASTAQKTSEKAKTGAKKAVKSGGKRLQNSKFNPGSKHWRAPVSYSVRKQHNLLIGMWFASSAVYAFAYYNSQDTITIQTFWKRFIAIQFVFFVLSIAVLFDTFARVVGLFSTLVFLGICFTNQKAIIQGFSAITAGIHPPIGAVADSVAGDFSQGVSGTFGNTPQPSDSGGDFSGGISGGFDPSTGNGFNNGVTT